MSSNAAINVYGPAGAAPVRYVSLDANDILCWSFDESASPFTSSGNVALNLTAQTGSVLKSRQGVFNLALSNGPSATAAVGSTDTALGESNSISVSCWVYLRSYGANFSVFVVKSFNSGGLNWTAPSFSALIGLLNSNNGSWQAGVTSLTVGGANENRLVSVTNEVDRLVLNQWTLIGVTYDASTGLTSAYKNGDLVGTNSGAARVIQWGTHGPWQVAGHTDTANENINGIVDDVRVCNVVRSQNYYMNMYRMGVGLY